MNTDLLDRKTAENLVEAIIGIEGVADLNGGQFGEVAMLFPGKRVRGIHVRAPKTGSESPRLEVSIVVDAASYLPNLEELASRVRDVAGEYVNIPVDVTVADVA